MNLRMDGKCSTIQQALTLDHFAFVIDQQQIGYPHLLEGAAHGVDPEVVQKLWIPHGNMAGNALVKSALSEYSQSSRKPLFTQLSLDCDINRLRGHNGFRDICIHYDTVSYFRHCVAPVM